MVDRVAAGPVTRAYSLWGRNARRGRCRPPFPRSARELVPPAEPGRVTEYAARLLNGEQGLVVSRAVVERNSREELGDQQSIGSAHHRVGIRDDEDLGPLDGRFQ